MDNNSNKPQGDNNIAGKGSWIFSKKLTAVLFGVIFCFLGAIGFTNYGFLGTFLAYGSVYVFGCFAYLLFSLSIVLGVFLLIAHRWPKFRINFTGLGYVLLFLFGALASSIGVENLTLPKFGEMFQSAMDAITISPLKLASLLDAPKVSGGFVGYLMASLFLTGLGKIGAYIFCYLFLLIGSVLVLRPAFTSLFDLTRDSLARQAAKKQIALDEEKKKKAAEAAGKPANKPAVSSEKFNPFKESAYDGYKDSAKSPDISSVAQTEEKKEDETPSLFGFARKEQAPSNPAEPPLVSAPPSSSTSAASPFSSPLAPARPAASPFTSAEPMKKTTFSDEDNGEVKALADSNSLTQPEANQIPSYMNTQTVSSTSAPAAEEKPVQRTFKVESSRPAAPAVEPTPAPVAPAPVPVSKPVIPAKKKEEASPVPAIIHPTEEIFRYPFPSINLLVKRTDFGKLEENTNAAKAKVPVINDVFQKLNIGAEVESFTIGPSVTRFNIKREPGVRVSQISNPDVESELKIDLNGDMSVRIAAVVRGQDTSGVEIGNVAPTMVSFYDCFGAVLKSGDDKLMVPIGEDISSEVICVSLDDLPHLLISGTTGSGKSVFIHSIIMSLIMRNYPDELKLILVDPKQVEFTRYSDMPHLFCPIITNITYAVAMLKRLVNEMERRYTILARYQCSNIHDYNKVRKQRPDIENLPNIVCVIDEFADMMGQDPRNVEALTQRLAQKARAAGIYLIISTQRPSVKCITGTIKANIPARIALMLPSNVDSRTILDEGGAETLLGKGDLLARIPSLKSTVRLQSAFVSNEEISAVVDYLKKQAKPTFNQDFLNFTEADQAGGNGDGLGGDDQHRSSGFDDEMYDEVKNFVVSSNIASTSSLQRHFNIGYSRAASMLDALEEEGIVRTVNPGNRKEVVHPGDDDSDSK
jgi:S-DNA-T family DNA segregation ATPase FtsK/SpoIIIE